MCGIVSLPQLTALQREQAVLPHRHGGMGLLRLNEDVATAARLSSAALAFAALGDGTGKGLSGAPLSSMRAQRLRACDGRGPE